MDQIIQGPRPEGQPEGSSRPPRSDDYLQLIAPSCLETMASPRQFGPSARGRQNNSMFARPSRRQFLVTTGLAATSVALGFGEATPESELAILPKGGSAEPLPLAHFPDRVHAFIWRNWPLISIDRLALVLKTSRVNVAAIARKMGLPKQPRINSDLEQRSYITVIKRNWHLLPYDQLLQLLGWNARQLAYTLREDDFLYIKLGSLKPKCPKLVLTPATEATLARAQEISAILKQELIH